MAYVALPAAEVSGWDDDYDTLKGQLATENDREEKRKLTARMASLATKIEERLNKDIATVKRYHAQHVQVVNRALAAAEKELKVAKKLAADFKSSPKKTELVPQLKRSIQKIGDLETVITTDAFEFGDAWKGYRANVATAVPVNIIRPFQSTRAEVINDKSTTVKLQKVKSLKTEANALLAITQKAAMKRTIAKTGTGQRPIGDAQQAARDIVAEMDTLLDGLRNPTGLAPKPGAIASSKNGLVGASTNPNYLTQPNALTTARGYWKNVETAHKLMLTKASNMEKILATRTKGFRSTELTDAIVKSELVKAGQRVKDAKSDIKGVAADVQAAKKAIAKIEADAKKRKITR